MLETKDTYVYKIDHYQFTPSEVQVGWMNPQAGELWAAYGEFSKDGRSMFMQPRGSAPGASITAADGWRPEESGRR